MARIPVLRLKNVLVVSLQVEMEDRVAIDLQEDILSTLARTGAGGLIVDVSGVEVVDSFLGRIIGDTARMASMMGANTVLVGIQPAVAITLTELGLVFSNVRTALNLEKGLALLKADLE
ncbi:MAG: STAS domain-containing protein [Armatimonadetes bacterium]|nr:STAS domain-containing protein [Armatimonadota bacterium]